jgi:hypothetical protein
LPNCVVAKKTGLFYHLLVDNGCSKALSGEQEARFWIVQVTKSVLLGFRPHTFLPFLPNDEVVGKRGKKQVFV